MPVKVLITAGTVTDCTEACNLIEGIEAKNLIADRGYDTNDIVESGMQTVTPPKKKTEKCSVIMTVTSIKSVIWLKMPFCT